MRKIAIAIAAATATLGTLGLAGIAAAGHDANPSERVASYSYDLDAVQSPSVPNADADGTTRIKALPNGKIQVIVEASGLAPDLPHAMHLHGIPGDEADHGCPDASAAGDDEVITTMEGGPFYGGILVSLTTEGDTSPESALALDRFPEADEDGNLSYSRTFSSEAGIAEAGTVQVVVHGIDFDGTGTYAFNAEDPLASQESSVDPSVPLEATVPVLCGGIAN